MWFNQLETARWHNPSLLLYEKTLFTPSTHGGDTHVRCVLTLLA